MNLQAFDSTPFKIVHLTGNLCSVTFTLPSEQINAFVLMLTSLTQLFRGLGWKAKTNIDAIHDRVAQKHIEAQKFALDYETTVVNCFDDLITRGISSREAFTLTVSTVKLTFDCSSYDMVKRTLTTKKRLKKTGFYKQKHQNQIVNIF